MKAEEIIEVLNDFGAGSEGKWVKRLTEAVYIEIASSLQYSTAEDVEEFRKSITSYVMRCYDQSAVSLVLKLVNTEYEHLVLEAIERFREEKK
jgi:hypothetical protein